MTSNFTKSTTFVPIFKLKRRDLFKISLDPFPDITGRNKFKAVFDGFVVEVHDESDMKEIFSSGCYGRGSNSRSTPACLRNEKEPVELPFPVKETLVLSYEEAFFLMYFLEVLEITDAKDRILSPEELFTKFNELNSYFTRRIVAYIYLKSKNWIIRDGTKFGSDFLIYKKSIRIFHASFIVHVIEESPKSQKDLQGHHRTAENSAKDLLYLTVHPPEDDNGEKVTLDSLEKFKVTELIVRRFNFVSFKTK
ncbi:TSEN2 family protein [Megaselia abdita]